MPQTEIRRETARPAARLALTPRSYNAENHTVELVAATGFKVRRYDWQEGTPYFEQLLIDTDAVDGKRVDNGVCPLLDAHSRWSIKDQLGAVTGWRVEKGALILDVRFGTSDAAVQAEADVAAGVMRGVSIGYAIEELRKQTPKDGQTPTYTVTRWALLEVSLVPVPADPDAGVRAEGDLHPCIILETTEEEVRAMPPVNQPADPAETSETRNDPAPTPAPAPAPEQRNNPAPAPAPAADANGVRMTAAEALDFVEDARAFGDDIAVKARGWATDKTPDEARRELVRAAAEAQRGETPALRGHGVGFGADQRDHAREGMADALVLRHRPGAKLEPASIERAREWRGMTLLEMVRMNLEANGAKTRGMGRRELASAAFNAHTDGSRQHSTSDFPFVLSNVAGKTLRAGYDAAPQTFKAWQRRATAPDFKQITRLQMGGAPSFLLVPEGGQFKQGTIGEGREVYSLATYGRIFSVTRQTLINDDLDAFTRIPEMWGRAAADFESDAAYAPLIANPAMGDGVTLFHATHGNLAGSGGAIAEGTIQAGELAMMHQTGIEGRPISASPKFLIVAPKDKVAGQKLLTAVLAAQTSNVNVYSNSLDLVVEQRLRRTSGATPWFLAADPAQVDTIEYAYLEGDDGVFLEEKEGFEVDGMQYKARLDFASKAIDYRGLYEDPGT